MPTTPQRNVLITGTSRGLGLEMVRQWSADPNTRVFAASRNPDKAEQLQQIKKERPNVDLVTMDVSDEQSIRSAFTNLTSLIPHLSLVINNAAIQSSRQPFDHITTATPHDALLLYQTNVIGPLLITQLSLPLLTPSPSTPLLINISSTFASIHLNASGNDATYKMSKAALNQQTRTWAREVEGVAFVALSPGWVDTDMGSKGGRKPPQQVEETVAGMKRVIEGLTLKDSGKFLEWDGSELPW